MRPQPSSGKPVKKLTLTVTQEAFRSARVWAAQCDTSISARVGVLLEVLECPSTRSRQTGRPRGCFHEASYPHPPVNQTNRAVKL
jgi:hypothetical protein